MWLSSRERWSGPESAADVGVVTLGGDPAGVQTDGERRDLPVYGPGGYCWRPAPGQKVLVIKAGGAGEVPCVAGTAQAGGAGLLPGEVLIASEGGGAVKLTADGAVDLLGEVRLGGVPIRSLFQAAPKEEG